MSDVTNTSILCFCIPIDWQREGQSNAEIDYVIQYNDKIIPVKVKAGSVGSLRSLHYFMHERGFKLAIRIWW